MLDIIHFILGILFTAFLVLLAVWGMWDDFKESRIYKSWRR